MKLTFSMFIAVALFAQPLQRTPLSDKEKMELFNSRGDIMNLYNEINKLQNKANALRQAYDGRVKIMSTEHHADNCKLDEKMEWSECPSIMERKPTK